MSKHQRKIFTGRTFPKHSSVTVFSATSRFLDRPDDTRTFRVRASRRRRKSLASNASPGWSRISGSVLTQVAGGVVSQSTHEPSQVCSGTAFLLVWLSASTSSEPLFVSSRRSRVGELLASNSPLGAI